MISGTSPLLANSLPSWLDPALPLTELPAAAQAMLDRLQTPTQPEEEIMFTMDIPAVPTPEAQVAWVTQADATQTLAAVLQPVKDKTTVPTLERPMEYCVDADSSSPPEYNSAFNGLPVLQGVLFELGYTMNQVLSGKVPESVLAGLKVTVIQAPLHGTVARVPQPRYSYFWRYFPEPGYVGADSVVFKVEARGRVFTIKANLLVHTSVNESANPPECEVFFRKRDRLKGSGLDSDDLFETITPSLVDSASPLGATRLAFADLDGPTLAQTTGEGPDARITLDDNAAGHGWYLDYTPYLNEDYLPTSTPNEWVAREGSAAAGKMDLLSVLLHEYGHALGIAHSADGHDYMAATLAPGVRRLPSADELALMAQLVGELKTGLESTSSPAGPSHAPLDPTDPLGAGLGLLLLGRLRRSDYGGFSVAVESATLVPSSARQQIALNSTLVDTPDAWQASGAVLITPATADRPPSYTLRESATAGAQSQLAQGFLINPGDRSLSFTVDNHLAANAGGPGDAFEVALLDANDGHALARNALDHSDALINRQTDGREHLAAGVHTVGNPDGSTTYHLDLSLALGRTGQGLIAPQSAWLSFDLLGFGGAGSQGSQITLRDIHLARAAQAVDDAFASAEDTPLRLDVLANDRDVLLPGDRPILVSGPTHGQLALNADGSFVYTPDADWHGEDGFTYTVGDGSAESNVATVRLTVAPVNDAPIARDGTATLLEDGRLVLDLAALGLAPFFPNSFPAILGFPSFAG